MLPLKFTIKCGNFAVLVDLHVVLPLGGRGEDAGWFTAEHIEDVTALVRESVDQRVKQYTEFLHNRGQPKHKKELATSKALYVKGNSFNVVANFVKRHLHLRCIVRQQYGELRVFPERYVVCVSCPEDASAHHGNPSPAATELNEQSRSEYFSRTRETQELLNSTTKTKRSALQKIAKKASGQQELTDSSLRQQDLNQRDQRQKLSSGKEFTCPDEIISSPRNPDHDPGELVPLPELERQANVPCCPRSTAQVDCTGDPGLTPDQQAENGPPGSINPSQASAVSSRRKLSQGTSESKRCKPSIAGEDPHLRRAKRACLGLLPISTASELTVQAHALESSAQTSKHDPLPSPPLPLVKAEAKAQSKAFPVSECNETTLEVELLTPGKRAQRLPLTSNNTEQTNQNRLAASLRGLSVKPASSASISSRSTGREEGSENVPRTSRLRRLKRS